MICKKENKLYDLFKKKDEFKKEITKKEKKRKKRKKNKKSKQMRFNIEERVDESVVDMKMKGNLYWGSCWSFENYHADCKRLWDAFDSEDYSILAKELGEGLVMSHGLHLAKFADDWFHD